MENLTKTSIMISDGTFHDVYNLRAEAFTLENIAISLGNVCRWGGHLGRRYTSNEKSRNVVPTFKSNFYSVAEHSVLGARYHLSRNEDDLARLFLMHDAGEPFVGGDIVTPLKMELPLVIDWESDILAMLTDAYSLKGLFSGIKETDRRICRNETIGLYGDKAEWAKGIEPLCYERGFDRELIKLHKWEPERAMNEWYDLAKALKLENKYVT